MRLPWREEIRQNHPTLPVNIKAQELETAKEILAEIFHVRPADVEEMIQKRLEDRCWQEKHEEGLWPATFCLGE
jgi:ribosomal protein L23